MTKTAYKYEKEFFTVHYEPELVKSVILLLLKHMYEQKEHYPFQLQTTKNGIRIRFGKKDN